MYRAILLTLLAGSALAQPIRLYPDNPHYYEFRGRPFIAVTSAEHYGMLLNADFDYKKYLDTMSDDGMRLTRFFTGLYREGPGSFRITGNTLAPAGDRFITPYLRSGESGALDTLAKWDLTQWNPVYWRRLKDIVEYASEKGIIIQVTLFCTYYRDEMWEASPYHPSNNINSTPEMPRTEVLTLGHPALLRYQETFVRRMVTELNGYDNVMWEICNEPYFHGVTLEWQYHIAKLIRETETGLPKRHLIARNVANNQEFVTDPSPNIDVLHFHYARPPVTVAMNFGLGRLIGFDETGFDGPFDYPYRIQAWDFVIAGGGHYNHLDYSFTVGHEDGTFDFPKTQPGGGGPELRRSLKALNEFMDSVNFVRMRPADELILSGVPAGASARILAEDGRACALYLHHGRIMGGYTPRYLVRSGVQQHALSLNLPAGGYTATWWNPKTGKTEAPQSLRHTGGPLRVMTPEYREDIALVLSLGEE